MYRLFLSGHGRIMGWMVLATVHPHYGKEQKADLVRGRLESGKDSIQPEIEQERKVGGSVGVVSDPPGMQQVADTPPELQRRP